MSVVVEASAAQRPVDVRNGSGGLLQILLPVVEQRLRFGLMKPGVLPAVRESLRGLTGLTCLAGTWCVGTAARVGEAEAGIAGGAFGEGCGENSGTQVVVVAYLGGCLAG